MIFKFLNKLSISLSIYFYDNSEKENICIIPARGGSKRIPKKNLKYFYGKPIIYYAIKNAKKLTFLIKSLFQLKILKLQNTLKVKVQKFI